MKLPRYLWPSLLGGLAWCAPANAVDAEPPAGFGGPDAVENLVAEDARSVTAYVSERLLDPWFDWKAELTRETGLSFGLDYSPLFLAASDSLGEDQASGAMLRFFGSWELLNRGAKSSGALVWKLEHRHAYGSVAPSGFALGELGYAGLIGGPWSDQGGRWTNLYWRQRFNEGRSTLIGGRSGPSSVRSSVRLCSA